LSVLSKGRHEKGACYIDGREAIESRRAISKQKEEPQVAFID
jgi:hypothetical protein